MKKKKLLMIALLSFVALSYKNVYAFDSNNYKNKNLCGNYEVAGFHSDGEIVPVSCHNNYEEARNWMKNNGATDLAIMTKVNGQTKIIDANVGLLDLSVNPETLTYFYTSTETTSSYTYMDTGSLYGGVDGAHMDTAWSNKHNSWMAKVKTGNFTGWIKASTYEIVPITWVRSTSSYTVTNESIRHNYVAKIQNTYNGSAGSTIGPKPEMLNQGTYYSYDGHYFYTNIETMIKDYKNGNYNNSVNKNNVYYNYYMYLSNHTKTAYSSTNIDEYIRNNLGYTKDVYGNSASQGTSRLYGMGTFFYYAQEKYGVNAILSLSLSRNETGNGRSSLAINKNNGFGLNAVDSNPIQAANWYPSFSNSILGYASKWITYGYAHPRDWRYFGPQFGDKWIGMNVKYASDTYWSEKMASNYYYLDKSLGLQDYNYYQLGVVTGPTITYQYPNVVSKQIYTYPEKEDAVVIIDEVMANGEKWYKVVSDLNIDANYNEITSGDYNWNSYVYIRASQVQKINKGKNGYISPNSVFEYQDKDYEYDLHVQNAELKPQVAISTKNTNYYYNSTLTSKTGSTLLKDRYVMVYATALDGNTPVAYLVTSDYKYDQKHWVSADSIRLTNTAYGKVSVTASGNCYTWVNYNTDDASYSLISGLYTNTYVPILETIRSGNDTWYKVPVNLTGNNNVYGYTLSQAQDVSWTTSQAVVTNSKPTITASDITLEENATFDPKANVKATDPEDGDITSKIEVTENTVNTKVAGDYKVTYKVTDSNNQSVTKTIKVTVKLNNAPVITATDKTLIVGDAFDPKKDVKAQDSEDGDLTSKIEVTTNTVNTSKEGTYKVIYKVVDSKGKETTKEIKVVVNKKEDTTPQTPVESNTTLDKLKENSSDGEFYLEELTWDKNSKKFTISGYEIILNQNNNGKEYYLVLVNKDTKDLYKVKVSNWNTNTPYDLGEENGKTYTNSWFKGTLDLSSIPNGDYDLYMLTTMNEYSTIEVLNNYANKDISRRGQDTTHGYNFKVQQKSKTKEMILEVRDKLYTTTEAPTSRNMVNGYEEISFKNNKLYLYGYSYDINGVYDNQLTISRKLVLENNNTYKQTELDLGSTKGPFTIETLDKKDKTYAWFEKELDVSNLTKGTYTLLIYTKTSNAENFDELQDRFRLVNSTVTINNKKYTIKYNKDRTNRVELTVE
jgi:beta-N-acetylglucosaminidase